MQSLLPHPLHHEVVGHPADPAPVPHVQAGVEVQRVNSVHHAKIVLEVTFNVGNSLNTSEFLGMNANKNLVRY